MTGHPYHARPKPATLTFLLIVATIALVILAGAYMSAVDADYRAAMIEFKQNHPELVMPGE
jgi:hypothetical protein